MVAVPDAFTTAAIADLDAILARLDARGGYGLATIHIQWAIELLRGEPPPAADESSANDDEA